eukprot:gene5688-8982_t
MYAKVTVLVLLLSCAISFALDEQGAKIFTDGNETVHVISNNKEKPFVVNGIDVLQAIRTALVCTQTPCKQGYYRAGCENLDGGECRKCQDCPDGKIRENCGHLSEGVCVDSD